MDKDRNNIVYLLVGTRAAGKTQFANTLITQDPSFTIMSRDAILIELFGETDLDSYSGGHQHAYSILNKNLEEKLSTQSGLKIILDCWTGNGRERMFWISKLRRYGATKVIALLFTTPLSFVEDWFWLKPGIAKATKENGFKGYSESAPSRDYALFQELSQDIEENGFDAVIRVNPLEPIPSLVV